MVNFSDLNLPAQATSIVIDLNNEVMTKEEALRLLSKVLQHRVNRGYESSELIEVMRRVWNM